MKLPFQVRDRATQGNFDEVVKAVTRVNVTQPARVINTNYQPSTSRVTLVVFEFAYTGAGLTGVEMLIGAANPATTHLGHLQVNTANEWLSGTFLVPVGWWYRIARTNGTANLGTVTEFSLG